MMYDCAGPWTDDGQLNSAIFPDPNNPEPSLDADYDGQSQDLLDAMYAATQFVFLVLFSFSFFLNGFTGLAITLDCIVTLFIAMQVTARVQWRDHFAAISTGR
jgi:hypothetical protein